ncbi:MAG TPA: hypothetical protein DCZ59_00660 [Bacteroidetes bacterium]|nr:hypothetical protein [Bacteroidota bacterium]
MMLQVVDAGAARGEDNMRLDVELADRVRNGAAPATMRLYTWDPWCVSLGKHQPLSAVVQSDIEAHGYDVVHRPTGGRAVLHADEVTYCVCVPVNDSLEARRMYAEIHTLLYGALQVVCPELMFAAIDSDLRTHYASSGPMGQACFTSHARTEILWHGRKVVGSAQRVIDGVLLQHGSILCGAGHERLADVVTATDADREQLRHTMTSSSATLSQAAGRRVTAREVLDVIAVHVARTPISGPLLADAQR